MKKIKIIHLVNELKFDGSSRVVWDLCRLTNRNLYEIAIVSLTSNIELTKAVDWPTEIQIKTFNFQYDDDYSLMRYLRLYFQRKIVTERAKEIIKCIEEIEPDILHCHIQPRELLIPLSIAGAKCPKLLLTDHLVRLKDGQYPYLNTLGLNWIYKRIYNFYHVVAVGESVMACHQDFHLVAKNKIHTLIENRVDTDFFVPMKRSKNNELIRVVYVARLEARKGQHILIHAWSRISTQKNAELILVGSGPAESELKQLVEKLNLMQSVFFQGSLKNVLPILQSADIAVFPSLQEGLPLALLEKMSCALPVLASDIEEFEGIISDGENGVFFKSEDVEDLASKLDDLIHNPERRLQLGEAARKFVIQKFHMSGLINAYENVYTKILNSGSK